jgi:hypothetical protein
VDGSADHPPATTLEMPMMREIVQVKRCNRCDSVVQAMVDDRYLPGTPEESRAVYWLPRREHGQDACDEMLTIAREEWPRLFEVESPRNV